MSAIEHFAFGTMNRIKLDFETSFWDKENPGYMILRQSEGVPCITTAEEDGEGEKDYSKTWSHHILGFDAVINQPNMLMGWISGNAARLGKEMILSFFFLVFLTLIVKCLGTWRPCLTSRSEPNFANCSPS